ncbi:MAG: trimethylamine corrinoid protein 2 [Anaerolineae bacterium]
MFELKPDFEGVMDRYEAWWQCEIVDRPLVSMSFGKPLDERVPVPEKKHVTWRERWMDTTYVVERTVAQLRNRIYYADALPVTWPNLGPEVFSAFYGCPLEFGETTSWSEPILEDWTPQSVDTLQLDRNNVYFRKILELTDALLEVGRDTFIVGYTDIHPGGDAIAAFRDPQKLCIDMIEHPDAVKALCERVTDDFIEVYDLYYEKLSDAGMPSTTWLNATCRGRYHVPSNDFSCMVSEQMFEEIFLPGIVRECQHMDRNIYHLDGPQALRYLDTLLAIPEIHAIQWVPGAGQDHWADWVQVYRRIQAAGKACCLYPPVQDLDDVIEALRPEGAWLIVSGVENQAMAQAALKKVERWRH